MVKIVVQWTTAADGSYTVSVPALRGRLYRVVLKSNPGSNPTVGYKATLNDGNGIDVLGGHTVADPTTPDDFMPLNGDGTPYSLAETCVLSITGAGNGTSGSAALYMQE